MVEDSKFAYKFQHLDNLDGADTTPGPTIITREDPAEILGESILPTTAVCPVHPRQLQKGPPFRPLTMMP